MQQATVAGTRRLRLAFEAAVTRMSTMPSGERASRAALQAVINDLRAAVGAEDAADVQVRRDWQRRERGLSSWNTYPV